MNSSFKIFNKILQGEHMAIDIYQEYIDELPDSPLRNHLISILTDHKNHAVRLAYFIQTNGGKVKEGTGWSGLMTRLMTKVENRGVNESIRMLEKLYVGEDRGLARSVQLSEHDLSETEREVLAPIFSDEHDHLKQLLNLKQDLLH